MNIDEPGEEYIIDEDPSDMFNSMVREDPISDDALDGFIWKFCEMTELT